VLAESGEEALGILSKNTRVDLVLTDMQMPYMDGVLLSKTIHARYPALPLILLSSIGDEYTSENRTLFSAVLTKPIKQHILSRHILCALQEQAKPCTEQKTTHEKLPADFALRHPLQVLIAEDNLINQQVILHILHKLGYQPLTVENGLEAVAAATEKAYDLILMDMQMPEMDGLDATRAIRRQLQRQPVIIALTANTMQGDEEICLRAGMNDYLGKPVKLDELVAMLEKWSSREQQSARVA
jgi:CheY-like chemotaxis protein